MDLSREVYWLLGKTARSLKLELRKQLEDYGISWPQYHALYHIGPQGIPANELARELECNASNMTGLIDRMRDNGLVYREHSASDRRVWLIRLTEKGARLKAEVTPRHQNNIIQRMDVLCGQEQETLKYLLKKLLTGREEMTG